jgi:hypothetical protein
MVNEGASGFPFNPHLGGKVMRTPTIRIAVLAGFAVLASAFSAYADENEALSPALEKRLAAIEKKIDATQYTFDQILKHIEDVLWFERVGDVASVNAEIEEDKVS